MPDLEKTKATCFPEWLYFSADAVRWALFGPVAQLVRAHA
jgi:hypothetical protein